MPLNVKRSQTCASRLLFCRSDTETLLEAIDTAAAVHQLLLAGVERVTLGADFDTQLRFGGTRLERRAAHAADDAFVVLGMDLFFHAIFTSFANKAFADS